ncbi:MAG: SocA family protein [Patescibacteria group bacterium]|nr:SocA family protein [Patescibacteria group bacterium]
MSLDQKKYENVVLYLCDRLGGEVRGKKKLAKLLYFADFDFYEKNEKSITGDTYKALPMGPFPISLENVSSAMTEKREIQIDRVPVQEGYNATEVYKTLKKPDLSLFTSDEIRMLDRVVSKYGHLNGKQLEDLTHAEAPYAGTQSGHEIYYELAYYRGTDFTDL